MNRLTPFALMLAPWVAPGAGVQIASDFPGGNIVFERIEGDDVFVHQDLRDTRGDWFYWYFAVRGAQGRELTFHFTKSRAIGPLGPGISRDGGRSWAWLGRSGSTTSFTYGFGPDETEVRFSFGMPYQHADLMRFLERHAKNPCLKREVLGRTRKGRPVDLLRIARPGANPAHKVLITARHHACEMMASYVAEGLIEAFLEGSETGRWLREHVDCAVVPMVDMDGVEGGDQGKNRQPHDHKADYRGTSIYPEVAALRNFLAEWAGGRPDIDIDLHNPGINHNRIYSHALRAAAAGQDGAARTPERKFLETLEAVRRGPLEFRVQDSVDFAARMAAKSGAAEGEKSDGGAQDSLAGKRDGAANVGFEIPYALVGDVPVTADSARAFGHDIARAVVDYLKAGDAPSAAGAFRDSGFEATPSGELPTSGRVAGWEIQRKGRPEIQPRLRIECIEDPARAKSGAKCLAMAIPRDTVGFEFVTVGQRVALSGDRAYEASVWVRWPDGPDTAPPKAHASRDRCAIVSFWARHRDGNGHFAGRDDWLFDNRWHRLSFRFCPTDPDQLTLVYVSLLPNQKPADTTLLVDDFQLAESDRPAESESRHGGIALDADFSKQSPGAISAPWQLTGLGGNGIAALIVEDGGNRFVRLAMGPGTSNFESAQVRQYVELREGARYEISCRMRWDNFAPGSPAPIVNFGIFHEPTGTWYGPVDQVLEKTGEWRAYRFAHIPPFPGTWKLYVQLNGWGNFGKGVTVSFDDFTCAPAPR